MFKYLVDWTHWIVSLSLEIKWSFLWKGSVKNLYSSFLESLFCKKSFMEAWNIMNKCICGTVSFSANGNTTLLKLISLFIIMIVKLPLLILFTFWSVNLTFRNLVQLKHLIRKLQYLHWEFTSNIDFYNFTIREVHDVIFKACDWKFATILVVLLVDCHTSFHVTNIKICLNNFCWKLLNRVVLNTFQNDSRICLIP